MLSEYNKCRFCSYYDNYEGCTNWFCSNKDGYKANQHRIIDKANEEGLSVADVIALIETDN